MILSRISAARQELLAKTHAQVDADSAEVWAARAIVAIGFHRDTGDNYWYRDAIEYAHEAIEHAAGGPPGTLEMVQSELKDYGL